MIFSMTFLLFFPRIQGAELAADEGRSAAALAACRTLAEELTEVRFPAPRILSFKVLSLVVHNFLGALYSSSVL